MKVIFELPFKASGDRELTDFRWLNNKNNWLFIIEDGKRIRTISVDTNPAKEIQFANLADKRLCTGFAWNYEGNLLALVIDERQIYLWDAKSNQFHNFKPSFRDIESSQGQKRGRASAINLIGWSKLSNKLVICSVSGYLTICNFEDPLNVSQKLVDNSNGVLRQVIQFVASDQLELFACITKIYEVLVMTFDGETKFYLQVEGMVIIKTRFSFVMNMNSISNPNSSLSKNGTKLDNVLMNRFLVKEWSESPTSIIWLSYQSKDGKLLLKRITYGGESQEATSKSDLFFDNFDPSNQMRLFSNDESGTHQVGPPTLVDHFWISHSRLLCCDSSGTIRLLDIKKVNDDHLGLVFVPHTQELINIRSESMASLNLSQTESYLGLPFIGFDFQFNTNSHDQTLSKSTGKTICMAAMTKSEIFYYELYVPDMQTNDISIERVDDLDLSNNLKRFNLSLERVSWCYDCSMLGIQMTGGYTLVYRTKIENYMVASCDSKIAHLSAPTEITILDFQFDNASDNVESSSSNTTKTKQNKNLDKTLTLRVGFKPEVMAIGPYHLAVALNNRIRLYYLSGFSTHEFKAQSDQNNPEFMSEYEYSSIITSIQLSRSHLAILFEDGRVKLSTIMGTKSGSAGPSDIFERTFPDPGQRIDRITSFSLNHIIFIYTTEGQKIHVFSLIQWCPIQSYDHSPMFKSPVIKLCSNKYGNMYVCINQQPEKHFLKSSTKANVYKPTNSYLYDLNRNKLTSFSQERKLLDGIINHQIEQTKLISFRNRLNMSYRYKDSSKPGLENIEDAIWDTEGRIVVLLEKRLLHVMAILDHTIEMKSTVQIEYVATVPKAINHKVVHLSQGLLSHQTRLGRMINVILSPCDDEHMLEELQARIEEIKLDDSKSDSNSQDENMIQDSDKIKQRHVESKIIELKLSYLMHILKILPISRCKCIIDHLTSEPSFNMIRQDNINTSDNNNKIDSLYLYRVLAAWAIYTQNIRIAISIYRKIGHMTEANLLHSIMSHESSSRLSDADIRLRLLELLGCNPEDITINT